MEEKITLENGNEDTFFIADGGATFGIAFDKIFEQEQINVYNSFELNSKRNFKNLAPIILETYEEIFLNEGGRLNDNLELILFNILNAKCKIMIGDVLDYDSFLSIIDMITDSGEGLLLDTINRYVDDNYKLSLDSITSAAKKANKRVNEELQFSDEHAILLLKISCLYRLMIPIISVFFIYSKNYYANNPVEDEDNEPVEFVDLNASIFKYLFEKIARDKSDALRNKLYKLTVSRISKTAYSDKRFWNAAKQLSITIETEAVEIFKKLLINAIPKLSLDEDKNVVSFLQSVINNQIDFLFQNKFKYKFTSFGNTVERYALDDDDDDGTEFERMEIQMSRRNEGSYIIRKLNIQDMIRKIPEKFGVGVEDSEVKDMVHKLNRNTIQEEIVAMLTFKYFQDNSAMKFISYYQYCYLVIACKKYLEQHKLYYISQILTANCERHKERTNICGRRIRPEILSSKKYAEIFNVKYKNFANEVERPFLAFIGTVYSSIFTDESGNEIFDSSVKVGKIAEELLNLASLI